MNIPKKKKKTKELKNINVLIPEKNATNKNQEKVET